MVELIADWLVVLLEVGWCGAAAWWWKLEAGLVLLPGGGSWKLIFMQCQNVYSVNIQCQKCLQCKYTKIMFKMSDHHFILMNLMIWSKFVR